MGVDDEREHTGHSGSLSWRDVYTAVAQMEERMTKVLERIEAKFDNVVGDHESRLRVLETQGSTEAQEALRTARAIGVKYDALKERVDTFENRERGVFGTLSVGKNILIVIGVIIAALLGFLNIIIVFTDLATRTV